MSWTNLLPLAILALLAVHVAPKAVQNATLDFHTIGQLAGH